MSDTEYMRMLHDELERHAHRLPCMTVVVGLFVLFFLWTFHKVGAV